MPTMTAHVLFDCSDATKIFLDAYLDESEAKGVKALLINDGSDRNCVHIKSLQFDYPAMQAGAGSAEIATTPTAKPKKAKKTKVEEPANGSSDELMLLANDEDEPTPKAKKTKPKKSDAVPALPMIVEGARSNSLDGLRFTFCGTLPMGHATAVATASSYGATIAKKIKEADHIVLGKNPGTKAADQILECGADTINQESFLRMIRDGVTSWKAGIADVSSDNVDSADLEPPAKKQKK